jgi:hypothetical protein
VFWEDSFSLLCHYLSRLFALPNSFRQKPSRSTLNQMVPSSREYSRRFRSHSSCRRTHHGARLSAKATQNLKGRDRLVAQAASQAGLEISLKPFVTHDYCKDEAGNYFLDKFPNKKRVPKRTSDDTRSSFFGPSERHQTSEMADIWAIDADEGASNGVGDCEWNPEGYFGNEASSIDLYFQAVLLIEVPAEYEPGELETKKAKAN